MNTPAQRLARTRLAILEQATQGIPPDAAPRSTRAGTQAGAHPASPQTWRYLREEGQRQWARHPARLALQFVLPLAAAWARRHPVGVVTVVVLAAVLLTRARPWRHIRLSAVALAALRSAHLPSLAMSALAHSPRPTPSRGAR